MACDEGYLRRMRNDPGLKTCGTTWSGSSAESSITRNVLVEANKDFLIGLIAFGVQILLFVLELG